MEIAEREQSARKNACDPLASAAMTATGTAQQKATSLCETEAIPAPLLTPRTS
jgi:hypothetical protein